MLNINHQAAEAAHEALRTAQESRALERAFFSTVASALQPRDASLRAGFDPDYGAPTDHPMDPRNEADEDSFTSLQPLGDHRVMVVYSFDGNTDLSIDGVMLGGDFVHIDNFTSHVRGMWFRAIRAEERKAAEIQSWGE